MTLDNLALTSVANRRNAIGCSFAAVSCALYLPFAWLLQLDFTTNSYHLHWLRMWPVLPGLVAGIPLKRYFDDTGLLLASGFATSVILLSLTYFGARSRSGLLFSVAAALAVSIPTSILSHLLFRH